MNTISFIRKQFSEADEASLKTLIAEYDSDERSGVRNILESAKKKLSALEKERARTYEMFSFEREYSACAYICGIDEVGRGPLAGPVTAAAVILPKDCDILYLNDSKKLTPAKREELSAIIREKCVSFGVGSVDNTVIDKINILNATYEAMRLALKSLSVLPDILLNDAVTIPGVSIPQVPIIKGDAKSASIAAASIVAKVERDRMMVEFDRIYPGYGFASNKGYGSAEHMEAIRKYGPTPIHRRSFIGGILQEGII
ncbi:MAG: ribonuclease HII [Lachnospiraceae bacterium]|nr:ribonuclease HII [Lachnospiraceae bacterium]